MKKLSSPTLSFLSTPRLLLLPAALMLASAGVSESAVILTGTPIFDAGTSLFTYNYSVTNAGTTEEIIQVTFPVSPGAALMGITAPTGFRLTYDTIGARVNFIWDEDDFTPQTFAPNSTVSGFSFTSSFAPGVVEFTASDVNQDFTGFTNAPAVAVPEPSVLLMGLTALPVLLRRRRSA
ncbi:MAG: hypothetical protein JWL81_1568 [Verrucomicrobiales bacterium]|nr:hypothetical protein [Verrucomicrobiales bacterium]